MSNAQARTVAADPRPTRHALVWIDHRQADIIFFDRHAAESKLVRHHGAPRSIHHKAGTTGSGHIVEDTLYLNEVAAELREVDEILIVGPSHAKWELKAYVERRAHEIARRIVGVETINHPTEGQLLAYAQHYFVAVDRMRPH
jgi:stalled ribosome rescue protein Dom34